MVSEVNRKSNRIMWIRGTLKEFTINIFSLYAPLSGCPEEETETFWTELQEEMEKVESDEKCIVNGDMNGHIVRGSNVLSRIHGGYHFGDANEEGERVMDFALSNDLIICNTILKKRAEHLITYKSGTRTSQIDFMFYRRRDRIEIRDCKVILGDHVRAQHRLVILDLQIKVTERQITRFQGPRKIKWFKLKEHEKKMEFKERVLSELVTEMSDIDRL